MIFSTFIIVALGSVFGVTAQESSSEYSNPLLAKVLLYTYTHGFRHDSIPTAIKELQAWGPDYNVSFDATDDQSKINTANLAQYDAILCVHTTGNIFTAAGQTAFIDYLSKGGNFATIHAASDPTPDQPWAPCAQVLGATFDHHPNIQNATFVKEMSHPSTDPAPDRWVIDEEVYSFTSDPRKLGAKVVWSVDPASYIENKAVAVQGDPHPIAWYQDYNAGAVISTGTPGPGVPGRSFYSSLGHLNETWEDPTFMKHVMGGLTWTFFSNTTRVAQGLYNGVEPTIHTGSTSNATSATFTPWTPVLGTDATAPPPTSPNVTSSGSAAPSSTGSTGNNSGVSLAGVPTGLWVVAAALLGAFSL